MTNNYLTQKMIFKGILFTFLSVLFSNPTNAQNDYSVVAIPYQIYTATSAVQGTLDDTFSAPIPLTFDFDFYGVTYSSINVSTNGYISFDPQLQGAFSPWNFNITIPDVTFPVKNAFLGCYHDMYDNNLGGTITYAIAGSAPYRKFIVLFNNQSHFSCGATAQSSFQMILYETLNVMDVQLIDKQVCPTWNNGNAVTGIINSIGDIALAAPGRNTSQWTTTHEGWRFQRPFATDSYAFTKCDDATLDGITSFNLQVAQHDLSPADLSLVSFYETESDAVSQSNALANLNYTNTTANLQTIYANFNGQVKTIVLRVVDCNNDYDLDSVATADEDVNLDTNLANDDTDLDGIPNFADNDDDGDMVLTSAEYVFNRSSNSSSSYLDTDNDGILNYLDKDDDGDGILTINEDYNQNHNPADDDTNANNIPDYLESAVALAVNHFEAQNSIVIYPNPASSVLNIDNALNEPISNIAIYAINGAKVKEIKSAEATQSISVADLQSGIYFVKIEMKNQVFNYKFIKK
jgi:hypothetical protein